MFEVILKSHVMRHQLVVACVESLIEETVFSIIIAVECLLYSNFVCPRTVVGCLC